MYEVPTTVSGISKCYTLYTCLLLLGYQSIDLPRVTELSNSRTRIPSQVFLTPGLLLRTMVPTAFLSAEEECAQHKGPRLDLKVPRRVCLPGWTHPHVHIHLGRHAYLDVVH